MAKHSNATFQIKFLALKPDILNIFLEMDQGSISIRKVLAALEKFGERKDLDPAFKNGKAIDEITDALIEAFIGGALHQKEIYRIERRLSADRGPRGPWVN